MSDNRVRLVMEDCVVDVEKSVAELLKLPPVKVTIDGREVEVPRTTLVVNPVSGAREQRPTTIYDAARKLDIKIPILCHREHMTPVAACRFCTVDVGGRVLTAACHRQVEPDMKVATHHTSEKVRGVVKVLTELPAHRRPGAGHEPVRLTLSQITARPRQGRFVRGHRRRSQCLHPVRSLHPRLQ
jgi:hypothetical protein